MCDCLFRGFNPSVGILFVWTILPRSVSMTAVSIPRSGFCLFGLGYWPPCACLSNPFQSLGRDSVCLDRREMGVGLTWALRFQSLGRDSVCLDWHFNLLGSSRIMCFNPSVGILFVWTGAGQFLDLFQKISFNPSVGILFVWTHSVERQPVRAIVVSIPRSGFCLFGPNRNFRRPMSRSRFQSLGRDSVCLDWRAASLSQMWP